MLFSKNTQIEENTEIAGLFDRLEFYAKQKPDVFAFFCKKYERILYDNFDWAYALFHTAEQPAGVLDKFMPYIQVLINIIGFIAIILMVKK